MEINTNELTNNWFDKQAQSFEVNRFGAMALMMTAQSCWGSVAAIYALKADNIVLLVVCAAVTMASNSAFIAQSPAKWCLGIFYTSVIANLVILLLTIF
ncbi:MAG: hypothetical protein IPO47_11600 [Bacteroidetes bacterium]|jgi:hypothetical protein|nr:hypothetical protein [Saprospiraceae bacterium]MBK6858897.1 hypothetical protein [Saprospiraceae bacterium]MBK9556455.1 hypothetical protein [Bacteroidota bacterium]